jgi:hypothetical protein
VVKVDPYSEHETAARLMLAGPAPAQSLRSGASHPRRADDGYRRRTNSGCLLVSALAVSPYLIAAGIACAGVSIALTNSGNARLWLMLVGAAAGWSSAWSP